MTRTRGLLAALALAGACTPGDKGDSGGVTGEPEDSGDADTDTDTDADADADSGGHTSSSDDPPVITWGDAWCYHHSTGEERDLWKVVATVTEPQGLDTLIQISPGGVTISQGGTQLGAFALACDLSTGDCATTFGQEEAGALCDQATSFTIGISAVDEDDNWAVPYVVTGRQGASPDG